MGKKVEWDFALVIAGASPDDLPVAHVAEYLVEWAALLGSDATAMFRGVVRGCVALRAQVAPLEYTVVEERLQNASNDDETRTTANRIERLLARDGLKRARVLTRAGKVLHMLLPWQNTTGLTVQDSAEIDGRVYRISGKDQSTSIGLLEDGTNKALTVETTSDALARKFAAQFKGGLLRIAVHGTWTRSAEGVWEPKRLIADWFEEIEEAPLVETMRALQSDRRNAWAGMSPDRALAKWHDIRYGTAPTRKAEPA